MGRKNKYLRLKEKFPKWKYIVNIITYDLNMIMIKHQLIYDFNSEQLIRKWNIKYNKNHKGYKDRLLRKQNENKEKELHLIIKKK